MNPTTLPRLVAASLAERLEGMPALVVTGARQTGKSTLMRLAPDVLSEPWWRVL